MSLTPKKTGFLRLLAVGLFLAPRFVSAHTTAPLAVMTVPENWGLSDSLGFFALVVVLFAVLVRRGLLRTNKSRS
jgi:hypothetical protein